MSAMTDMPESAGRMLFDVPASEYHKRELGVASNSVLKILREKTPAHYRHWVDAPPEPETPSLAFGRAYHCRVLEPGIYRHFYAVAPDFGDMRSSINREKRDRWVSENPGVTLLSAADAQTIEDMHAALMSHRLAAGMMQAGHSEVTMRWEDSETGVRCKARADWIDPGNFVMDLKTTDDASPSGFAKSIAKYGYHIQGAHYRDGAVQCGEPTPAFLILAQEKSPPYLPAVYCVNVDAELAGYEQRNAGLRVMRDCLARNEWPGYPAGISEIQLPSWALKD